VAARVRQGRLEYRPGRDIDACKTVRVGAEEPAERRIGALQRQQIVLLEHRQAGQVVEAGDRGRIEAGGGKRFFSPGARSAAAA
jgi:hypothetical protein